jgi:ornithine carbamoyltransferase
VSGVDPLARAGLVPAERHPRARHLVSLADLEREEIREIVVRGAAYSAGEAPLDRPLEGRVVGIYFRKTSTRTRTAFSSGALRLGASIITYGPDDLQENTGETADDTGEVLSRMLDVLVARTAGTPEEMRTWASQNRMPVVNAMSADEHPTQGLTDLTTLVRHFGALEGIRVLYLGEGNNTAAALALGLTRFEGAELHVRTPAGYEIARDKRELGSAYAARFGAVLTEDEALDDLPAEVDVVYTTRWQTTGTSKPDPNWRRAFEPFQVDEQLMRRYPGAIFMHDLPAHRGEEVTAGVLDGPRSIAFEQAENKLHSAMAVLEWCLGGDPAPEDG